MIFIVSCLLDKIHTSTSHYQKTSRKTSQADLIFYNGINLETGGNAWFTKLVENAKKTENKDYFAVSEGVDVIYLEGENEKGKEDPHAWLNLENGIIYAQNIAKQLIAKDPSNKEFYEKNLKEYTEKLDKLDKEAKDKFNAIDADKKLIVNQRRMLQILLQSLRCTKCLHLGN